MTNPVSDPDSAPSPTDEVALDAHGLPLTDPDFEAKQKAKIMAYFSGETDEEPTLYAADPGWWRDLSARIPGLLVTSAGGACPFQSEGTLLGYPYYFRYRGGWASLKVGHPDTEAGPWEPLYSSGMEYGDEYAGALTRDEFITLMTTLVAQLERAPYLWKFSGVEVTTSNAAEEGAPLDLRFTATDTPAIYRSWGHTPAEAYDRLHEPAHWLIQHGWTVEAQQENFRQRAIDPTPLNDDERVFPDPEPVFEVRP